MNLKHKTLSILILMTSLFIPIITSAYYFDRPTEIWASESHFRLRDDLLSVNYQPTEFFSFNTARNHAARHWNDGRGFCADFTSGVLSRGGFVIQGSLNRNRAYTQFTHLVTELGFGSFFLGNGRVTQNGEHIRAGDLVMWDHSLILAGVTDDVVTPRGSGGHIIFIAYGDGEDSLFIAKNPDQYMDPIITGGYHGLWLIQTSALIREETNFLEDALPINIGVTDLRSGQVIMQQDQQVFRYPNGGMVHRTTQRHNIFRGPDYGILSNEFTSIGEIISILEKRYMNGYIWGRLEHRLWNWTPLYSTNNEYIYNEPITASRGEMYVISDLLLIDDLIWGRISNTSGWIILENITTGEVFAEMIEQDFYMASVTVAVLNPPPEPYEEVVTAVAQEFIPQEVTYLLMVAPTNYLDFILLLVGLLGSLAVVSFVVIRKRRRA